MLVDGRWSGDWQPVQAKLARVPELEASLAKATATVSGLFETWECVAREIQMHPAELLAIFSDGVTAGCCCAWLPLRHGD